MTIRLNINDNRVKKITQKSILVDIKSIEKISRIESNEDKEINKLKDSILAKDFFMNNLTESISEVDI